MKKQCRRGHTYESVTKNKGCSTCNKERAAAFYRKHKSRWVAYKTKSRREHPELHRQYELKRRRDKWALCLIVSARRRAKKIGVPFNISATDLYPLPAFCPVLGIPLTPNIGKGMPSDNSPSLDRMVGSVGYVKGNVRVISYRANAVKNNATADELRRVADWMDEHAWLN